MEASHGHDLNANVIIAHHAVIRFFEGHKSVEIVNTSWLMNWMGLYKKWHDSCGSEKKALCFGAIAITVNRVFGGGLC
jgi:hypothetical protein